jgi:PAS domain S-box-containing protein
MDLAPVGLRARSAEVALKTILELLPRQANALREIIDASPEPLIAFDANRTILHANRAAEEFFRHGAGALNRLSTDLLLPERLRQPNAPPMVPMADLLQVELRGLRGDNTELTVEWLFGSALVASDAIFVMTMRDSDAVDSAIEALRESEERFRLLVEGVHDYAIFMLDPHGRVSSWNAGAERSNGWSENEIVGKPYEVFFTLEERAARRPEQLLASALADGSVEVSGWRVRKDGTIYRASAYLKPLRSPNGELRGFAEITRDLTETLIAEDLERRLRAERASREAAEAAERRVRASEERVRRLQRVTAALSEALTPLEVAAVVLDQSLEALEAHGGAIYLISEDREALEFLDQRGHPALIAEYSKLPLDTIAPLTDAVRERSSRFFESMEACTSLYPELREAIQSGGFEASAAIPLITHGSILGVLGIRFLQRREFDENDRFLILTLGELCAQALERARLFAAESAARADAEAANRSKDEFLAMLGHELRNPLAPIVTALSMMNLRRDQAMQKERDVIERQVTHLVRLVDDLLDVSRITKGKVELKRERLEISTVVAKALELSSPLLEQRHQHLNVSVPTTGLTINGDPTRLAQVLSNLVNNAAKYTLPGGHIEIAAERKGERIVLTVRDDGMGISPEMLPRVFDFFVQERQSIDRSQGGLGLGLAIAKNLITMHDGTVSAFSEGHGKGCVMTVELPAHHTTSVSTMTGAANALPPISKSGRRVLVVDDNTDAADLLSEALMARGHVAIVANDGPSALRAAHDFSPEVAVLDIGLPVMDGYELAEKLRREHSGLRLIAVTGYGQEADHKRSTTAGFVAHLVKPVELVALYEAVAEDSLLPAGAAS